MYQWYSKEKADALFATKEELLAGQPTTQITNLQAAVATLQTQFTDLTTGAPQLLNTLAEISTAISNDPNFATDLAQQIASLTNQISAITLSSLGGLTQAQVDARVSALADLKGAAGAITLDTLGGITPVAVDSKIATSANTVQAAASTDATTKANAAQAAAVQRANHTGTQSVSTITGLGSAATQPSSAFEPSGLSTATAAALSATYSTLPATTVRVLYVSKSGNDSSNGRSWGTAFLTVAAALAALGTNSGTVFIGAGLFNEAPFVLSGNQTLKGVGSYATTIQLASTGTLISLDTKSNCRLESIGLRFPSSSVTGTLVAVTNTFDLGFYDVRFSGTKTSGQVGVNLYGNSGDSHFLKCKFEQLDVAAQNDTTVNYYIGCVFSDMLTAHLQGGDSTGAKFASGLSAVGCTFRGSGAYYLNIQGTAQNWHIESCWTDGSATVAVNCGSGTFGPWLLSLTNMPALVGASKSLVVNAATKVNVENVTFVNTGSNPTEVTINAANAKRGHIGAYRSAQGNKIESLVPASWDGYRGYALSGDYSAQLLEETAYVDSQFYQQTHRKMSIKITNRTTGTAATTITFPSPFETTAPYNVWVKTFDNTGIPVTFNASSMTIPTGYACTAGLIILEGY
jgi:hypothetical protein